MQLTAPAVTSHASSHHLSTRRAWLAPASAVADLRVVRRRSPHRVNESPAVPAERAPDTTRRRLNRIRRVTAFFIVIGSVSFFASFAMAFFSLPGAYALMAICAVFNPIGLLIRALAGRCGHCRR